MTVQTLYRLCVWLPLIVPAVVAGLVHGLGYAVHVRPLKQVVQVLLGSLIYGGIPYAALAVWATWWIGGKGQAQIERQMLRAPLIMVAVFVVFAAVLGFVAGHPRPFLALGLLGAVVIIPLGYGYVAVVILLRRGFESQLRPGTPAARPVTPLRRRPRDRGLHRRLAADRPDLRLSAALAASSTNPTLSATLNL